MPLGVPVTVAAWVLAPTLTLDDLPRRLLDPLPAGRSEREHQGREEFVARGCGTCHLPANAAIASAPDLTTQGGVRSAGWHRLHLAEPKLARANSNSPAFPELFVLDDPQAPIPLPAAEALVAYLLRLQDLPARRGGAVAGSLPDVDSRFLGDDDAFRMYCSACHGTEGRGDGAAVPYLRGESLPRDLTTGTFRVRSSPDGPTRKDLARTITHGLPGSAMPDFSHLAPRTIEDLVDYVLELGEIEAAPEPAPIAPSLPTTPASIARGEELLVTLECGRCHGDDLAGRRAADLDLSWTDEAGRPLPYAPDLAADPCKGGEQPADLYRTLFVGQGGSPMPSYADALPDAADRWALVHALRARRERAQAATR